MRRTIASIAAVVGALAVVAACSGDDDAPERPTTQSAQDQATTTEAGSGAGAALGQAAGGRPGSSTGTTSPGGAPETTAAPTGGCTEATGGATPSVGDLVTGLAGDVDGDGRDDQAWVGSGPGQFGIATAAGGSASAASSLPSPSLAVLVADADRQGPFEVFVSDGTTAELWAYDDCALSPVIGPDGQLWLFDLGERGNGTGVGCVDVGGVRHLVGLNVTSDDGTTVAWKRTIIELDGLSASIGSSDTGTFTRPGDDGQIDLLHTVTCHDLTIEDDGIAAG